MGDEKQQWINKVKAACDKALAADNTDAYATLHEELEELVHTSPEP